MPSIEVKVRDVRKGDEFRREDGTVAWTAIEDAAVRPDVCAIRVQYADGGIGYRHWGDPQWVLTVVRGDGDA